RKGALSARNKMGMHYETTHKELLPSDMDGYRWFYYLMTGKTKGSCCICHQDTEFNRATMKYARFCKNPMCKQKYRQQFMDRMINTHGKITLLNDPEQQKKMQANRKISGIYNWSDGVTKLAYLGSYEKDFFQWLDTELHWPASDIISPSPHTYVYEYNGEKHFYIPDAFIPSLSLEIEIKSTVRSKYQNPTSRAKDEAKDAMMRTLVNVFRYIRIEDKDYTTFKEIIKEE
ncbi:MAG: hypothetical protein K2N48_13180, partial [Muribaculaceae bacterium]|nr:hypothetical protein [Muribaculaceae bacterium]